MISGNRVFIASLVLLSNCILVSSSAAQQGIEQAQAPPELTISSIFREGGLTGRAPETVKWSPDGKKVSYVLRDDSGEHGQLWYIDVSTGKPAVLVAQEKLATLEPPISKIQNERERERVTRYSVAGYHWAPDSQHLLFDSHGQLWLYTLQTGTAVQVTSAPEPASDPKFSPDGKRLAYVREHDLWVRNVSGKGNEKRLTEGPDRKAARLSQEAGENAAQTQGTPDNILNGEVDWVYAEELSVRSNYFWSPDGTHIAYLQMDETKVPTYPIEDFIPTHPTVERERYPKAGDPNPVVRVGVISSNGGGTKWITPTKDNDIYIPRFGWVRDGLLFIEVLNRAQNKLDLYFADADSGRTRLMLSDTSPTWVNVHDDFKPLKSGDQFLWSSWRDGHTHLYLYRFDKQNPLNAEATVVRQLTRGDYETFGVDAVDENSGTVYYTSNQGDPRQRQIYSAKLAGGAPVRISREEGTHAAEFPETVATAASSSEVAPSTTALYYVDMFSSLSTPPAMSLCKVGGECSPFWQSRAVTSYNLIAPQLLEFKAADRSTTLYGMILIPPENVIQQNGGKVPVIMNPYGGPGGQSVRNAWGAQNFFFHNLLAREGIAVLTVDNRGMSARGREFQGALKSKFGEVELADQLAALDQAFQRFQQLDRNRVGWWGWSYGGYMTLYAMTHSPLIKAGVSVAPVTDWRNYDSIYTERYMGVPKTLSGDGDGVPAENAQGYERSSPVNAAKDLRGALLIVHGTSDDNVHMQNTIQMINALITAGKLFDVMLYPRKTHGIAGHDARTNLYTRIQRHFERELLGKSMTQ